MDKIILVDINMFSMNQRIYMPDGEQIETTISELPNDIVKACYASNIYTVEIIRGNLFFTKKIEQLVAEKELSQYKVSHIKFKEYKK